MGYEPRHSEGLRIDFDHLGIFKGALNRIPEVAIFRAQSLEYYTRNVLLERRVLAELSFVKKGQQ